MKSNIGYISVPLLGINSGIYTLFCFNYNYYIAPVLNIEYLLDAYIKSNMNKIGVLIPQSNAYPTIGRDFIDGLRFGFGNQSPEIIIEGIGFANHTEEILTKIEKLVIQDNVKCIVALLGDQGLETIYAKMNSLETPMFIANMGSFPFKPIENNAYVFTVSYDICESLNILGKWAVENNLKKIGVSGSFNDVGYGYTRALESSLYAHGGEFAGHYTPPLNPRSNEAEFNKEFYTTVEADLFCELYNGVFAKENVDYLAAMNQPIEKPLFFTPFGLTKEGLMRLTDKANTIYIISSWLPKDLREKADEFDVDFEKSTGRYPSVFSVLGAECGLSIDQVLGKRNHLLEGKNEALSGGPRNNAVWDKHLHLQTPQYLWNFRTSNGSLFMEIEQTFEQEYVPELQNEEVNQGWHNAYLCY